MQKMFYFILKKEALLLHSVVCSSRIIGYTTLT